MQVVERLIEQTREKDWNRVRWEAGCRQAGFEVVGDEHVAYLVPIYYTPSFVDYSLIPFIGYLLQQEVPVCRLDMLPTPLQQVPMGLIQGLSAVSLTSPESLYAGLHAGTIALGLSVTWLFEGEQSSQETASEPRDVFVIWEGKKLLPSDILKIVRPNASPQNTSKYGSMPKWYFVYSHRLPLARQSESMKAYLEWVLILQKQLQDMLPEIKRQIQALLFPEPIDLEPGASYSLNELQSLFPKGSTIVYTSSKSPAQSFVYRGWRFEIVASVRDRQANGMEGVRSTSISLETLLGLKAY